MVYDNIYLITVIAYTVDTDAVGRKLSYSTAK